MTTKRSFLPFISKMLVSLAFISAGAILGGILVSWYPVDTALILEGAVQLGLGWWALALIVAGWLMLTFGADER